MIDIGSVVRARVDRIEHFGLYFRHGDETVIVLAPEVSWTATGALRDRVSVGDEFDVLILRRNYQTGELVGSIRRLQHDQNPFRALSRLPRGEQLEGKVAFAEGGDEVIVMFANGAWGVLSKKAMDRELRNGDIIQVEIDALDIDEARLRLVPAREVVPGSHHPVSASTLTPPLQTSR